MTLLLRAKVIACLMLQPMGHLHECESSLLNRGQNRRSAFLTA